MTKKRFQDYIGMFEEIISRLSKAPNSQLEVSLREECRNFNPKGKTDEEVYNFLDYLSKQPINKISPFVKTLCDVSKFYELK